jgi:hypothetical protein
METKNAIITSTSLGVEDHGIFSAFLTLDFGGSGQGFGGYALDQHNGKRGQDSKRIGTAYGMEFIRRIMDTVGVSKWEDLRGKYIRVRSDHRKIEAIGHLIEDRWFCPETDLREFM